MKNGKINMLQLVNGFAIGGGEMKVLELVQRLDKDRYNITVCSVGQGGPLEAEFRKTVERVEIYDKKFSFDFSLVTKVARLLKEQEIEILQTTLFYADIIGAYASYLVKVPVVVSWEPVTGPFAFRHYWSYKLAMQKIDCVVAVSEDIRQRVIQERKLAPEKVMTIHYGVDLEKFAPEDQALTRADIGVSGDHLVLGTVARFDYPKGHKFLINAAPGIVREFPNVRFVFVGDGPLRNDVERQINQLGLNDYFVLLGFRRDVKQILGLFDLFILPSLSEGLPNAVLEAMACSNPVVATAVNGVVEVVKDGETGYLVPPKNPYDIARAVIRILKSPATMKEMGTRGRERVAHHFSVEQQISKFEQLYLSLYEQKQRLRDE
jgi:glycosyltransferase involved in cell wall biosynthesis